MRDSAPCSACSTGAPVKTSGAMPHQAPQDGMSLEVAVQAGEPAAAWPAAGAWARGRRWEPSAVEQAAGVMASTVARAKPANAAFVVE
ncbi:hypothetical protein ACFQYP_59525 [Nonomuraea antimicrobica]